MTNSQGEPFVLEINTVPGMTATSLVPDAAIAIGIVLLKTCAKKFLLEASVGKVLTAQYVRMLA